MKSYEYSRIIEKSGLTNKEIRQEWKKISWPLHKRILAFIIRKLLEIPLIILGIPKDQIKENQKVTDKLERP